MDLSPELRGYLVREWRIVAERLSNVGDDPPTNLPEAIYFYSAFYGAANRVMNIAYSPDLALIHVVASASHSAINQRINEFMAGQNPSIGVPRQLFARLAELVGTMADRVERDEATHDVLAELAAATNTTTGNGFYLFQTRGVGL